MIFTSVRSMSSLSLREIRSSPDSSSDVVVSSSSPSPSPTSPRFSLAATSGCFSCSLWYSSRRLLCSNLRAYSSLKPKPVFGFEESSGSESEDDPPRRSMEAFSSFSALLFRAIAAKPDPALIACRRPCRVFASARGSEWIRMEWIQNRFEKSTRVWRELSVCG